MEDDKARKKIIELLDAFGEDDPITSETRLKLSSIIFINMHKITNIDNIPKEIPIFPLSNCLLLPKGTISLNIFEPRYLNMTEDAISSNRLIGMIQPKNNYKDEPELYPIGCVGKITHFSELENQKYLIELTGVCRFQLPSNKLTSKNYRIANIDFKEFSFDLEYYKIELNSSLKNSFLSSLKITLRLKN